MAKSQPMIAVPVEPATVGDIGAHCDNCGTAAYEVLYPAGRAQANQIVRCQACGLMYAYPLKSSNLASYSFDSASVAPLTDDSPEVRRGWNKLPDYQRIGEDLLTWLPQCGQLVEVGAFSGILLDAYRKQGWQVTGIEPDGRAVAYGRARFGIDLRNGTLESAGIADGYADAVVMLHVIEHIDRPAAAVEAVRRLLRPDGIFVVETPTYDSLAYKLLGRRERSLSCNGHIFFYTEATLRRLLQDHGFEVLRVQRVGRTMSVERLLWNVGVMSKSRAVQGVMESLSRLLGLERRHLHLNARDMIRVFARRST
jgi:SAM-dependent methyltransferase